MVSMCFIDNFIELDDGNYGNIYRKALAYDGKNHGFRLRFPQQTNPWNERKNILKNGFTQFSTTWRINMLCNPLALFDMLQGSLIGNKAAFQS